MILQWKHFLSFSVSPLLTSPLSPITTDFSKTGPFQKASLFQKVPSLQSTSSPLKIPSLLSAVFLGLTLFFFFTFILSAGGCTATASQEQQASLTAAEISTPLIGTWVYQDSDSFLYEFHADGTGLYSKMGERQHFRYHVGNGQITFLFQNNENSPVTRSYTLSDHQLNIKDPLGNDSIFLKTH